MTTEKKKIKIKRLTRLYNFKTLHFPMREISEVKLKLFLFFFLVK